MQTINNIFNELASLKKQLQDLDNSEQKTIAHREELSQQIATVQSEQSRLDNELKLLNDRKQELSAQLKQAESSLSQEQKRALQQLNEKQRKLQESAKRLNAAVQTIVEELRFLEAQSGQLNAESRLLGKGDAIVLTDNISSTSINLPVVTQDGDRLLISNQVTARSRGWKVL